MMLFFVCFANNVVCFNCPYQSCMLETPKIEVLPLVTKRLAMDKTTDTILPKMS